MIETGHFAAEAWNAIGGDHRLLECLRPMEPPVALPSRLNVIGLAHDSVSVSILALHEARVSRGLADDIAPVRVQPDRLVTSIRSERHFTIDGKTPDAWAALSGFFRTADGWVRTHGNYPHHAERLRRLLGLPTDATKDEAAETFLKKDAQEIEDDAARAGAIAVRVREPEEWAAHPHAAHLRATPLCQLHEIGSADPRPWSPHPDHPLTGVRVLDLTRVIAGPVATRDLAFAGADVLRIDTPTLPEVPWRHLDTGQGKRSTLLDLTAAADRRTFDELLTTADVVVTGYRPGSLDRLGLSPDELTDQHPGLIVAAVSAWGQTGPWSDRRGFDSITQAASGIAMIESDDTRAPGALPAQALDHSAGHLLAAAITRALLLQRAHGGSHTASIALARVAQALLSGGHTDEKAHDTRATPTLQTGSTEEGELVVAAPVLTYDGAPTAYSEIGRPWARDKPEWARS